MTARWTLTSVDDPTIAVTDSFEDRLPDELTRMLTRKGRHVLGPFSFEPVYEEAVRHDFELLGRPAYMLDDAVLKHHAVMLLVDRATWPPADGLWDLRVFDEHPLARTHDFMAGAGIEGAARLRVVNGDAVTVAAMPPADCPGEVAEGFVPHFSVWIKDPPIG